MTPPMPAGRARLPAVCLLVLAAAGWGLPSPVRAQGSADRGPSLDRVETVLDSGRVEEARAALDRWFRQRSGGAPAADRARAHLLRARLASEPAAARREYTRVALEGGRHGARARLRLAQLDLAQGRLEPALEELELLRADYPGTPLAAESWLWTGRVHQDGGRAGEACRAYRQAVTTAGRVDRPELRRTADQALDSCAGEGDGRAGAAGDGEDAQTGSFAVQLGAFSTEAAARALRERLGAAGVDARVVRSPDDGLHRVRAGRFPRRAAAEARSTELEEQGFRAIVVRIGASGDGS